MRIETLIYFQEIANCRSFTKASRKLYVSQQGLSKAVKSLEKELSTTLFTSGGEGLELTEDGKLLLELSYDVTSSYGRLFDSFSRRRSGRASFRNAAIVAMPYICNKFYDCLEESLGAYGLDELVFMERDFSEILALMDAGELDFAFVNLLQEDCEAVIEQHSVRFLPLLSMDVVAVVPPSLIPRCEAKLLDPKAVMSLPLAYYSEPVLNRIVDSLADCCDAASPVVLQHSSNQDRIVSLMSQGKAATFGDSFSFFCKKPKANAKMFKIDPAPVVLVGFLVGSRVDEASEPYELFRRFKEILFDKYGEYMELHPVSAV